MVGSIEWLFISKPVSEQDIASIESLLNIKFPRDYIDCAKENHGSNPSLQIYDFNGHREAVFNSLLSFNPESSNFILAVYNDVKDRLPESIYPFADDPFGNLICFDYRSGDGMPTVVFWDHESAQENFEKAVSPICETFAELLHRLYTD